MKEIALLVSMFAFVFSVKAQMNLSTPEIISPSPDAAALGKYGQYPVSMNSGLVQIDIPIHTVKLPLMSLPVSISYHASGIKVDDISSVAGLGWALNAGGVITRSVRGLPDEKFGIMGTIKDVTYINRLNEDTKASELDRFYRQEQAGVYDSETDVYHYSMCGFSGSFRFDTRGNLIQVPLTDNKINFIDNNSFEITTNDGTVFYFIDREESRNKGGRKYTTSWYLSGIKTTDNRSVSFFYGTDNTRYTDYYISYQLEIGYTGMGQFPQLSYKEFLSETENSLRLQSIVYPEGSVNFAYKSDRQDKRTYRLTGITIKNNKSELVKAFALEHSYFNGYDRLKLDKLILLDSGQEQVACYNFGYKTGTLLPGYYIPRSSNPPSVNANYFGQDLWGYYNGVTNNKHLLVYKNDQFTSYSPANRSVNPQYAQACILDKITYPTGGYTVFEYEGNKNSKGQDTGGLRIKNVLSYKEDGALPVVRSYRYEQERDNITEDILKNSYTQGVTISTGGVFPSEIEIKRFDYHSSEPGLPLAKGGAAPVFYNKVTEFEGYPEDCNGKTEYFYGLTDKDIRSYNTYHCTSPTPMLFSNFIDRLKFYYDDAGWKRGMPDRIDVYKKEDGKLVLVKSTKNDYTTFNPQEVNVGFTSFANITDGAGRYLPLPYVRSVPVPANEIYQYADILTQTGLKKLTRVEETSYADGKTVVLSTDYSYDRLQNQFEITASRQTHSNGSVIRKTFEYPGDFKATSGIRLAMYERNMLCPVIIQTDFADDRFIRSEQTDYIYFPDNIIAPYRVSVKQGTGDSQTEITYSRYDSKGNIIEILKKDNTNESFVWGYNGTFLTARLENISCDSLSANQNLVLYLSQLQNYTALSDPVTRENLKALNDNIRKSLPANARTITCTYRPLVGITSMTDPSGATTFYDYDTFGRLKETYILENGVKKVLESYNYHHQKNK